MDVLNRKTGGPRPPPPKVYYNIIKKNWKCMKRTEIKFEKYERLDQLLLKSEKHYSKK